MGNLPPDITEEEMRKLFEKYGKAGEVFIHKDKGFGFIRLVSDVVHLGRFFVVMAHTGASFNLLIESSGCSGVLLIKPADDVGNLEYGIGFQVVCLELFMKNVSLGSSWQEL